MGKIITMKNEKEFRAIDTDEILYVEVNDYLCSFFIDKKGDVFVCTKSLKEAILELPDFFIKIRRNCLVNGKRFKCMTIIKKARVVVLDNGETLEISFRNVKPFIQAIKNITLAD
jgi:DNA-binding LytR/AlgR family response regulator